VINSPESDRPAQPSPRYSDLTGNEIERAIRALKALATPTPVPIAELRRAVEEKYAKLAKSTQLRMRQAVREAEALAGEGADTTALTPELVARFAGRAGAVSTTNGLLRGLRAAMRLAASLGWLRESSLAPCRWSVPDPDPNRKKHHSRADVAKVLALLASRRDTWEGRRLYAFAAVLAYTGLRLRECLRARVADFDQAGGFVFVRANGGTLKTAGSGAPVPLPTALRPALAEWLAETGSEWAFPNLNRLGPWLHGTNGKRACDRLKAAGRECGVERFTPHSLRHSLATHLSGFMGCTRSQIQKVLRHATEGTQVFYVHADLVNLRRTVAGFDYASAGPTPGARRRRLGRRPAARFRFPG
jgi:integrase